MAAEVEMIEHHLQPETLRVFERLVQYWRARPERLKEFLRQNKAK